MKANPMNWKFWKKPQKSLSFDKDGSIVDKMNDAELGALSRKVFGLLSETSDQEGIKRLAGAMGALYLITLAGKGGSIRIHVGGAECGNEALGDWDVSAQASDYKEEAPPVLLGGVLKPNMVDTAMGCFEKLTVMELAKND